MPAPPIKKFVPGDRVYVRAQQVWMILTAHVMNMRVMHRRGPLKDQLMEYGKLVELMGRDPRAAIGVGRELGVVGGYCIQNELPALNCLVVSKGTGTPGHGVVYRPGKTWQDEAREALRIDWFAYRMPTTGTFRQV